MTAAGCGNQHHQSGSSGQGITKLHHKKNASSKNQSSSSSTSQSASDQSSQQNSSSQSSDKQSAKLWNSQKDQQLEAFMNKWAPTMHQSYKKYDGHSDLKIADGMAYPKDFSKTEVNGEKNAIGWSSNGNGKYDYNVVAIYNYDNDQPEGHVTYAFAFHDGQPVALVNQSTNGTVEWKPTINTDVSGNFSRIAQGQGSNFNAQSHNQSKSANYGKYGNAGPLNVPQDMQGTWYSKDKYGSYQITFGANTIRESQPDMPTDTYHIYKKSDSFKLPDTPSKTIVNATHYWLSGIFFKANGLNYLNTRGWCQTAGDGAFYATHTENIDGQQVQILVEAGGAGIWIDNIYYRSKDQANQYGSRHFKDLHPYQKEY